MDKGLIILNELKKELEKLKANSTLVIEEKDFIFNDLMASKGRKKQLELNLQELQDKEIILKEAPKKLKEHKNRIIKLYLFSFLLFLSVLSLLLVYISLKKDLGLSYVLENGIQLLLGGSLLSTIMGVFDYSNKKNKYKVGNLEEISKEIDDKTKLIEFTKNKIKELENKFTDLKNNQDNLSNSINIINEEILSIETIRNEIIETYCKDNKELDNLLDTAYDEKIEGKQKQKIKNGNR